MEHDGKFDDSDGRDSNENLDETLESLTDKRAVDNLVKGEIKDLCVDTPASNLKLLSLTNDASKSQAFLKAMRREKPESVVAAEVSSGNSTSSKTTDHAAQELSPNVSGVVDATSEEPKEPVRGSGNFDVIEVDHLSFAQHPDEYFEKVDIRKAPMFGYYIPPPNLVRWDLVEEERIIFLEHQTAYIADVLKAGHLEAAKAASIKIHQLARGIQLATKAIDSLNQSRRESVHKLNNTELKAYEQLNEEERAKFSHRKKSPKAQGTKGTTSKSEVSKLDAATRKRVKTMLDGYLVMELEQKEVIEKLTNKGLLTDESMILVKKLFPA